MEIQYSNDVNNLKLFKKIKKGIKKAAKGLAKGATAVISTATTPVRAVQQLTKEGNLKGFTAVTANPKKLGKIAGQTLGGALKVGGALLGGKLLGSGIKVGGKFVKGAQLGKKIGSFIDKNKGIGKDIVKSVLAKQVDAQSPVMAEEVYQDDQGLGYNELRVFSSPMRGILNKKGINPSSDIETLSNQFYDNVVRNTLEAYNSADAYQTPKDIIIDAIVKYFISAKNKKDSGAELGALDKIAAAGYEKARDSISGYAEDQVKTGVGSWIVENKGLVIGVGVGIFLLIIILAMKK